MATLQMTKQQTSTSQIPLPQPCASLAMANDPGKAQRLIEQGLPVTYEWQAREAHIGCHAVATFLQEQ